MSGFHQQDGQLYAASSGVVASALVSTINLLGQLNGNVMINTTWEKSAVRWRTRGVKDRVAYAIDASIDVEELEFKASKMSLLTTNLTASTMALYGTTATANFWKITTSTAPKNLQCVFQFIRTDDGKRFQIYAPRAQIQNMPTPFAVDGVTMQNLTFDLMASTSGKLIEYLHAVA